METNMGIDWPDEPCAQERTESLAERRLRQQLAQEFYDTLVYTPGDISTQLETVRTLWLHNQQQAYVMLAQVQATTHRKLATIRQQLDAMREPLRAREAAAGGAVTDSVYPTDKTEDEESNDQGVPLRRPDDYPGGTENHSERQP
jgi:hypothetical protein